MNGLYQNNPCWNANLYSFRELVVWILCTAIVMFGIGYLIGVMCEAHELRLENQERRIEKIELNQRADKVSGGQR